MLLNIVKLIHLKSQWKTYNINSIRDLVFSPEIIDLTLAERSIANRCYEIVFWLYIYILA